MHESHRDGYTVSTDPARLDVDLIHGFLTTSYWAEGVTREQLRRAIAHSMCFGIYHDETAAQVGFARVVTDRATFGYLSDVFVVEGHRGRGLARWLTRSILDHPELQGFRRWMLATRDAHDVYASVGFEPLDAPERLMQYLPSRQPR